MIALDLYPRLHDKVRLRLDRHSGQHMLVLPEKGLLLNATGSAVVTLCDGAHSVAQIVDALCVQFAPSPRAQIEQEVLAFLEQLAQRGLIRQAP